MRISDTSATDGLVILSPTKTAPRSLSVDQVVNGLTKEQKIIISGTEQFFGDKTVLICQ